MPKVLTDIECGDIIQRAVSGDDIIGDSTAYQHFFEGLAQLIADHFGGDLSSVASPLGEPDPNDKSSAVGRWCAHFHWNECIPDDGGVYRDYDSDVSIKEWRADEEGV